MSGTGSRGRLRCKLIIFYIAFNLFRTIFLFVHLDDMLIRVVLSYILFCCSCRLIIPTGFVGSSFLMSSFLC